MAKSNKACCNATSTILKLQKKKKARHRANRSRAAFQLRELDERKALRPGMTVSTWGPRRGWSQGGRRVAPGGKLIAIDIARNRPHFSVTVLKALIPPENFSSTASPAGQADRFFRRFAEFAGSGTSTRPGILE